MMPRETSLSSSQETLLFMKKIEEKKKILAEAETDYDRLCNRVDKTDLELSGLKMERFKVERLVQELESRVKVYEMREKELKEQGERAKRSANEAKNRLAQELEVRDAVDRKFSKKVMEMSAKYCEFKKSCYKTSVLASVAELKTSNSSFTAEIETKMQKLGLCESLGCDEQDEIRPDLLHQVYHPIMNREYDTSDVRALQKLVQDEVDSIKANNAKVAAAVDLLQKRKSVLRKDINCLKKTWNK